MEGEVVLFIIVDLDLIYFRSRKWWTRFIDEFDQNFRRTLSTSHLKLMQLCSVLLRYLATRMWACC